MTLHIPFTRWRYLNFWNNSTGGSRYLGVRIVGPLSTGPYFTLATKITF